MTDFSHDITTAPRGKTITVTRKVKTANGLVDRQFEEFRREDILAVHKSGNVDRSYWIPPKYTASGAILDGGRWSGFNLGENPIAWAPWPVYEAAQTEAVARLDSINHQFMAALDGVGSGA